MRATGCRSCDRGPSPRTRGSRGRGGGVVRRFGSIPAHAGEPLSRCSRKILTGVHPRARGGAATGRPQRQVDGGPSPRTRGSRQKTAGHHQRTRSIPAHAGEPEHLDRDGDERAVHPRARGGAQCGMMYAPFVEGPSPRTRGSHCIGVVESKCSGSIPAHAGEPTTHRRRQARPRVHPRARGGAVVSALFPVVPMGPSPRTRGSHRRQRPPLPGGGSIPAHAGEPL